MSEIHHPGGGRLAQLVERPPHVLRLSVLCSWSLVQIPPSTLCCVSPLPPSLAPFLSALQLSYTIKGKIAQKNNLKE